MPKTSQTHMNFIIRPLPGTRFTVFGSDVHVELEQKAARQTYDWLVEWLKINVLPEVEQIEKEIAESKVKPKFFKKGVPTATFSVPLAIPNENAVKKEPEPAFVPKVPSIMPVSAPVVAASEDTPAPVVPVVKEESYEEEEETEESDNSAA